MRLLVSGGTGFIGKHLIRRLVGEGHDLSIIIKPGTAAADLAGTDIFEFSGETQALVQYTQQHHFDGLIHLASLFLAQHATDQIQELMASNVLFGSQLLEAAVQNKIPWFLNTGTFWQHYQNQEYSPVNLYAATKQALVDIAQYYTETTNLDFVTLKLSDTFGPDDVRPKVLNLFAKIGQSGETLDMSPGDQFLDISYIDNVIDAYVRLIELLAQDKQRTLCGKSFAVKATERITLRQLAEIFERVTNTKLHIRWGGRGYRPREVMVPWEAGETVPGWTPKISLEEGIQRTFDTEASHG